MLNLDIGFSQGSKVSVRLRQLFVKIIVNSRHDTVQADVLLAKLKMFEEEIMQRNQVAGNYMKILIKLNNSRSTINDQQNLASNHQPSTIQQNLPHIETHDTSAWAQYTIRVNDCEQVQQRFKDAGIPTAVHYPIPLNKQPAVEDGQVKLLVGDKFFGRIFNLPMHLYENGEEVWLVIAAINGVTD